jgi:hypothetical protein
VWRRGCRDVSRRAEGCAAKPDPALSWRAAQERGRNLDFVGGRPLQQSGQKPNLLQASICPSYLIRGLDKLREPHFANRNGSIRLKPDTTN